MTVPSQRRRDPQPLGRAWELATAAAGSALIFVALAALTGLGIASALFGGGWIWPHGTQTTIHVVDGLLHGHPGRSLSADQEQRVPAPVPVYVCVAVSELALLATAVLVGVLIARYRRPGDARAGMATRREAQQALGLSQLRTARAIIRPDRYGPTAAHRTSTGPPRPCAVHKRSTGLGTHPQVSAEPARTAGPRASVGPAFQSLDRRKEPHDETSRS